VSYLKSPDSRSEYAFQQIESTDLLLWLDTCLQQTNDFKWLSSWEEPNLGLFVNLVALKQTHRTEVAGRPIHDIHKVLHKSRMKDGQRERFKAVTPDQTSGTFRYLHHFRERFPDKLLLLPISQSGFKFAGDVRGMGDEMTR
jgi:hypothetical protein